MNPLDREIELDRMRVKNLAEVFDHLFQPFVKQMEKQKRPSIAAQCCADELEALDMQQMPDGERQHWTPAYRALVIHVIEKWSAS